MTAMKKVRIARPTSSLIRLEDGEVLHVGGDAHKVTCYVAVLSDQRGLLTTWAQPADPEPLVEELEPFRGQVAQVVSEAGPTRFTLARRLQAAGLAAEVIAPSKTPTLPGPEDTCDRLECRRLAAFAQKGLLSPVRVPWK